MTPCMGGWCAKRDTCARHLYPTNRKPAERLCPAGETPHYRHILVDTHTRPPVESKHPP